ncbi:unnamed protein product [Brassica napus]|uniref:(rape) hypothetical protein n=1 Tax=Brassica napus TaxID=3708 RepID=A0A816ZYJ2_BRANA|nr:unnamed protein product [Brassica napus]
MQVGWRLSWSGIIPVPDSLVGCSGILHSFFFFVGSEVQLGGASISARSLARKM